MKNVQQPTALLFLVAMASPAWGATPEEAASHLAQQLAQGIKEAGLDASPVLLSPLRAPPDAPGVVADFPDLLTKTLVDSKTLRLVDRASLDQSLRETQLGALSDTSTLKEVGGGLGAKVLVTGVIEAVPGGHRVSIKAVEIETGKLLTSASATLSASPPSATGKPLSLKAELRRLSDLLAAGLDGVDGEARYQAFAVLPFREDGAAAEENELGLLIAAELTTHLQRDHNLIMVERGELTRVIDELSLGQTGLVDEATSAKVGKLAGAEALVIGSVSTAGDRYLVNAKVVDVESGRVVTVERAELPAADLIALSAEAVVLRSTAGAVFRSALLPGWGQFYNREPIKAGAFIGAEGLTLGLSLTFFFLGEDRLAYYDGLGAGTSPAEFRAARDAVESYRNLALAFGLVTVAVHLVNVFDAYLSGKTFDSPMPAKTTSTTAEAF